MYAEFNPGLPVIAMPNDDYVKVTKHFVKDLDPKTIFCDPKSVCARRGRCSHGP